MDAVASAALSSWPLSPFAIGILGVAGLIFLRGWIRIRRTIRTDQDWPRLWSFLSGLVVVFLATESPLDAFDHLLLSAHMTQHLLLMMIAPPLLLLARPFLPLLRGLPKQFVKEGLGPFLMWRPLDRAFSALTSPPMAWLIFAVSTLLWHVPFFYEQALQNPTLHDLQHGFFFWTGVLFWWPLIRQGPRRSPWPEWVGIPYLLFADIINTGLSAFFVFSGKILYPSYESVHLAGVSARDDQTLAGAIMWVPGSVIYLIPAIALTMRVLAGERRPQAVVPVRVRKPQESRSIFASGLPRFRRWAQVTMLLLAGVVIVDGLRGPQVAPLNLAGVLPWIHWRALSLLALLVVGNLFCMACPFTLVRDWSRKIFFRRLRWPGFLRTKWLALALIVIYFWSYEAFSLWDKPRVTAWLILGYFASTAIVDGFFRGASFCKYVCPIGQFHFVSSLVSPREVSVRKASVCNSCGTHDCIKGNSHSRGCELNLFQPRKASNLDCTFCMDCVQACPHDNVSLVSIAPAKTLTIDPYRSSVGRISKRTDLAALAAVIVFGAFVNAAGMLDPVMAWEHRWHARLGPHAMPFVVGMFTVAGVLLLPLICTALCRLFNKITGVENSGPVSRRFLFALVPLGVGMWAAHLLYHLATRWQAGDWLSSAQILLLDGGLLLTLYVLWQIATQYKQRLQQAVLIMAPWALLAAGLYVAGIWILFQPMQMRGMVH